jgi:CDP-diacylglycerol--glycerol-3-phosphate 3-phosphatidyltransferase
VTSIATIPNLLSGIRLLCVPLLLLLAWYQQATGFLVLLAIAFLSDALDGILARRLGQESKLGSRLDSWADVAVYAALPISAWWLWPDIVRREAPFVIAVVLSYTAPALGGLLKYGVFTSYHTWSVKLAALLMAPASIILFAGGPAWPFHWVTPVCVVAGLEELLITLLTPEHRSNVRSLWHVWRERR